MMLIIFKVNARLDTHLELVVHNVNVMIHYIVSCATGIHTEY